MEQPSNKTIPPVIEELLHHPQQFAFTQAIRLLQLWTGIENAVDAEKFLTDRIRFRPALTLGFNTTDITDLTIKENTNQNPDNPYSFDKIVLTASFLGLYGTNSPLPRFYTEQLFNEQAEDVSVLRDFLDIFNNRFFLLHSLISSYALPLYRALARFDPKTNKMLMALTSFGDDRITEKLPDKERFIHYAGLFFQKNRNALGLQIMLADASQCPKTTVHCNCFRLAPIPKQQKIRLGVDNTVLGENTSLGDFIPCYEGKIIVEFEDLEIEKFRNMTPGSPLAVFLHALIRLYCPQNLEYEVIANLKKNEAKALTLGGDKDGHFTTLGQDTWLGDNSTPYGTISDAAARFLSGFFNHTVY